jgi:predicted transcriptional regulator
MTVELRPETEARLLELSRLQGRDPADIIEEALSAAMPWSIHDDPEEERAILESLAAAEAGRERPLADVMRDLRQRRPGPGV